MRADTDRHTDTFIAVLRIPAAGEAMIAYVVPCDSPNSSASVLIARERSTRFLSRSKFENRGTMLSMDAALRSQFGISHDAVLPIRYFMVDSVRSSAGGNFVEAGSAWLTKRSLDRRAMHACGMPDVK